MSARNGEVMVKAGFDDRDLVDGLRGSSSRIAGWAKGVKHEFQGIMQVSKLAHAAMKGFGLIGIISAATEVYEIGKSLFGANEEAEKFNESIEKIGDSAAAAAEKLRELRIGSMKPADQLDARKEELATAKRIEQANATAIEQKKKELEGLRNVKTIEGPAAYYSQSQNIVAGHAQEEAAKKEKEIKLLSEQTLELKVKTAEAQKKVAEAQKAVNEASKKGEESLNEEVQKDMEEQEKRHGELHRLYMFHLSVREAKESKIKQQSEMLFAARSSFSPSHDQILQTGRMFHGRFIPSWSSGAQMDIDEDTKSFQEDIARYGYSGAGGDYRRGGIESMQKDLSDFLHGPGYKTSEEKMLDAAQQSEKHLKGIYDAFYKTEEQ